MNRYDELIKKNASEWKRADIQDAKRLLMLYKENIEIYKSERDTFRESYVKELKKGE